MIAATVCLASLVSLFPTNAQPFPLPVGSVLGNIDSVSQLKPHIVLDFAGQCANVTDIGEDDGVMFPNNTECLFENFVSIQFPGPTYGDMCSPPNTTRFEIISKLHAAASQCQDDDFDEFIETAANIIMQVFSMESCFEELCTDDESLLRVESNYIEHCADIRLPYPSESEFSMFLTEQEADDYVLTCMLDHVMHTSPFEFGLDSSPPVVCWPPGYDKIVHDKTICLDSLAPQSFDACSEDSGVAIVSVTGVKDDWFSMSMKMDDDYPYSYDDDHFDDDDDQYDDDGDKSLYERFCFILERLSTEQGLHCLANLCDLTALPFTDMPSLAPSQSVSLFFACPVMFCLFMTRGNRSLTPCFRHLFRFQHCSLHLLHLVRQVLCRRPRPQLAQRILTQVFPVLCRRPLLRLRQLSLIVLPRNRH